MTDYIKRADALKVFETDSMIKAWHATEHIPSADVAPIRHGRWKHERLPSTSGGSYAVVRCSACEYQYPMAETRYCPNCGAIMDDGYILITGKEQI